MASQNHKRGQEPGSGESLPSRVWTSLVQHGSGGISTGLTAAAFVGVAAIVVGIAYLVIVLSGGVEASLVPISVAEGEALQIVTPGESAQFGLRADFAAISISPGMTGLFGTDGQNGGSDANAALTGPSANSPLILAGHASCSNDVLLSNYQTSSDDGQFVDITNASSSAINIDSCSFTAFDVLTELSIGDATVALSGSLAPGETFRVGSAGVIGVDAVIAGGSLPVGPGGLSLLDAPPPADGTPVGAVPLDNITGMVYLDSTTVFDVSHLRVPAHDIVYDCIYGDGFPFTPVAECLGGANSPPAG